jgi:hypothetical protein
LIWRFRVAPADRRIVAHGRVESSWPTNGSVLVHEGVVYCAAGRSSYLEGGIRLCRLDAGSGELLSETTIDHRDPTTGHQPKGVVQGTNMPGALPDVLSSDGVSVFMRHQRFDLKGAIQAPDVPHLFSAAGFLESDWWHRNYWMYGEKMGTNYGGWPNPGHRVPAGRLLVVDDETVYGFGRSQYIHHGAHIGIDGATVYHFRPDRDSERRFTHYRAFAVPREQAAIPAAKSTGGRKRPAPKKPLTPLWSHELPILARGMVAAGDRLFLGGPEDILSSEDPAAALAGDLGGRLIAMSLDEGELVSELPLTSPPVFDGLIAAAGWLYLATTDGHVVALAGSE